MIPGDTFKKIILENERLITAGVGRILPREVSLPPATLEKVTVFYGVRRSGKTYLLFDLFRQNPGRALYMDFEDERLEGFTLADFERLRESFYELKPHLIRQKGALFLLDEVQNVKGWERFARRLAERGGARVFVTGSSSKMMPEEIHTAMRGRSWSQEILPFSFREYAAAKDIPLGDPDYRYGARRALVKNRFRQYLQWGGFPEIAFLKGDYEKRKVLNEYLEAMFFRDFVERFKIKNLLLSERLKERLFSAFSTKYSLTSFWKQAKGQIPFSKDSLFSYYKRYLESMLLFEVRKLSESSYQRLRNPAKIYLVDPSLGRRVTSPDWGRLLENVVFLELRRRGGEIFYFEGRRECDFVVKREQGWSACQVTWQLDETNREREMEGLAEACRACGLARGLLLTSEDEGERRLGRIHLQIRPVWRWIIEGLPGARRGLDRRRSPSRS